jgi:hypothetical protein
LTASNWVWACRGGVRQVWACSGVVRQPRTRWRWGLTASNWVWACSGGLDSLELGVSMQGSTASNWVWACRGWVRQPCDSRVWACRSGVQQPRTGCGHAGVGFETLQLGVGMQGLGSTASNWVWAYRGGVGQL